MDTGISNALNVAWATSSLATSPTDQELFCEVCLEEDSASDPLGAMAGGRRDAGLRPFAPWFGGLSSSGTFRLRRCG